MKKPSAVRDWFKADHRQLLWAQQYWANKGQIVLASQVGTSYEVAERALEGLTGSAEGREMLRKMRMAWNTYTFKERGNRKTCSFVLTAKAAQQLKGLASARDKSRSKILEELIDLDFSVGKDLKEARRAEVSAAQKVVESQHRIRPRPTPEEEQVEAEINELKAALKEQDQILEEALFENCSLRVLLEATDINPGRRLEPEQQAKAMGDFDTRMGYLRQDIRAKRRNSRRAPAARQQ